MHIVTDTGMDMALPQELMTTSNIHIVRHAITLDGKSYLSGSEIQSSELQTLLSQSKSFPTTSTPSSGDFADIYRQLTATGDPDILSIHMSSGLSGVVNAATAATKMVPEANVTIVDTKTLCVVLGWQVAAAAKALKAGLPKEKIIELIHKINSFSESIYTLSDLKYLIHGGRISHMKGLVASMLHISPLIGVEKINGTYAQLGMAPTFSRAVKGLVNRITSQYPAGTKLVIQLGHALNPEGVDLLRKQIDQVIDAAYLPLASLSPVLAAHTGPSMIGVAYAPYTQFKEIFPEFLQ